MLTADKLSWLSKLPTELIDMISGGNDGAMSRAEAEVYRLELTNERARFRFFEDEFDNAPLDDSGSDRSGFFEEVTDPSTQVPNLSDD